MTAPEEVRISVRQNLRPAPLSGKVLKKLIAEALKTLPASSCDLRVRIVGDPEMARCNERFLGHEGTTNVISFPEEEPEPGIASRVAGDILVSAPTCLSQTAGWAGLPEERIFFFVLHGILHLVGYDHVGSRADARRMRAKELEVYESVLSRRTA